MPKSVNKVNDNIEENISSNIGLESFDEEEYSSGLSEVDEQRTIQKAFDNAKVEELNTILQNEENIGVDPKRIVLDIIGKDKIRDNDLKMVLRKLTEKQLKKIRMNKNLILDITGSDGIDIDSLIFYGEEIIELTKEELEKVKENKNLILEVIGKIYGRDLKKLSEITKEELEKVKKNKELISEIVGEGKIHCRCLKELSELSGEELEKVKENKDLILEVIGEEAIFDGYLKELSGLTKEELEKVKENKDLILDVIGEEKIPIGYLKELSGLTKEELEKVKENKDLILEITGKERIGVLDLILNTNRSMMIEINKNELEKIKENKKLIWEITGGIKIGDYGLKQLSELTKEQLEKIKEVCYKLGINIPVSSSESDGIVGSKSSVRLLAKKGYGEDLCQIDEMSIDYCNSRNIKELWMLVMVDKIMKNSTKFRDYMERKQEYLKNNELIDDSKFKELFGKREYSQKEKKIVIKNGKYGKGEINQEGLGYCYLYTAYEILKKMNYFDVLIKTSLKESESGDGRYVKLPMGQLDGDWIYVSKNDIDKNFDIPDKKGGLKEKVSINSDSPLGFKIMEIAYIKKELMARDDDINKEFLETGDVTLTWDRLHDLEGYNTVFALSTLIGDNNIVNRNARTIKEDRYVDIVFDNFQKGILVELGVKAEGDGGNEVKLNRYGHISSQVLEKDIKIINKDKTISNIKSAFIKNDDNVYELIKKGERSKEMLRDIIDVDGKKQAVFYREHAYSLERCYIDKNTGEKRVCVINPWHTGIKFDMSLESAKKIFDWTVSYIDIDKLFR